jgi:hypothetical protein
MTWTTEELDRIGAAAEVQIAGRRTDGTLRSPRIVWAVRIGDSVYVRSVNGPDAPWYRGVRARMEGRVEAGGVTKDVTVVDADRAIDAAVDDAYRTKYHFSPSAVGRITRPEARSTTIELVPRADAT